MSRFLIATMPIAGHIAPMLPIARKLVERGHEVAWYGSKFYKDKIKATGAQFVPITGTVDFGDNDLNRHFPGRADHAGIKQMIFDMDHVFVRSIEGMYPELLTILDSFPADTVIADIGMIAATLLATQGKTPVATLNVSVFGFPDPDVPPAGMGLYPDLSLAGKIRNRLMTFIAGRTVFAPVQKELNAVMDRLGLPHQPFNFTGSPDLFLQASIPEIEYKRRNPIPPHVHYIGALLPPTPPEYTLPAWWDAVIGTGQPIVLVTQGTIATDTESLIAPTLKALANENVQVVATTGGKSAMELGLFVPKNAHVEPFIPFGAVMPHVSAFVTNGGFGGVMMALSNGLPLIVAGTTEDKPEVANRVQYAGVGINLKTATPTPEQINTAVHALLSDAAYRQKARAVQMALAGYDAPTHAAALIEKLAATRQPVVRGRFELVNQTV